MVKFPSFLSCCLTQLVGTSSSMMEDNQDYATKLPAQQASDSHVDNGMDVWYDLKTCSPHL